MRCSDDCFTGASCVSVVGENLPTGQAGTNNSGKKIEAIQIASIDAITH